MDDNKLECNSSDDQDAHHEQKSGAEAPLCCLENSETACSNSASKVPNNPSESALIAAEKIEVLIYYACDPIIISQMFIALCASLIHHFELPNGF
jgi:hypothetical protein